MKDKIIIAILLLIPILLAPLFVLYVTKKVVNQFDDERCFVKEVTKQVWTLDGWECEKKGGYSDLLTPKGVVVWQDFTCEKIVQ